VKLKQAVFIVGPTATGKSQLALEVAVARGLAIMNCDSLQIYKGLKIGSALPSRDDMKLAPHYLYSYVDKGEKWTAAYYVRDVMGLLDEKKLVKPAIFCGGSGFYIQALEKGMYEVAEADPALVAKVESFIAERGWGGAHDWLLTKDPGLERAVHRNDHYRIRRAIQIIMTGADSPSALQKKLSPSPLENVPLIKVALFAEKDVLRKRVEARAKVMLRDGFVEEVEELLQQGLAEWPPLRSVGYLEVGRFLRGEIERGQLVEEIAQANIRLIKKQLTWFKRDPQIRWFHIDKMAAAKEYILEQLAP